MQSMSELPRIFASEERCRNFLVKLRWPNGPRCACGSSRMWELRGGLFRCVECRQDISVTASTLFADSHQPLRLWFNAMWYVATQNNGTRALGLQRALRLGSYHTARNWLEKLRLVISALPHDQLFGTVEVDLVLLDEVSVRKRNRSWEETPMVLVAAQQTAS